MTVVEPVDGEAMRTLTRITEVMRVVAGEAPADSTDLTSWRLVKGRDEAVISALEAEFGCSLSPDLLRLYGTCRELAVRLGDGAARAPDAVEGRVSAGHAQHARLLRDESARSTGRMAFPQNVIVAWELASHVRLEDIDRAVRTVKAAHPVLRARFHLDGDQTAAWVDRPRLESGLEHIDLSKTDPQDALRALASRPMDLSVGTNRWYLLTDDSGTQHLGCIVDHIVFDGYSSGVLERDLDAVLRGGRLEGMIRRSHYFAFAAEQNALLSAKQDVLRVAWASRLVNGRIAPSMNALVAGGDGNGWDAAWWSSAIEAGTWKSICAEATEHKTTPFEVILSRIFDLLLDCIDGPRVGAYVAASGRTSPAHMATIGWYSSSVPVAVERQNLMSEDPIRATADALRSAARPLVPISWLIEKFEPARHGNFSSPQTFFFVSYERQSGLESKGGLSPCFVRRHDVAQGQGYRGASLWVLLDSQGQVVVTLGLGAGLTSQGRVQLVRGLDARLGTALVANDPI